MTMTEATDTRKQAPRRSGLDPGTATRLAATEYDRYLDQLRSLDPADWARPTDCAAWDVRQMACHNLGMAVMAGSLWETLRQNVKAELRRSRRGGPSIDQLTGLQVEERAQLSPAEIIDRYADAGPRAARKRARRPSLLRNATMTEVVGGVAEKWTLGYLLDTILTRDTWMHRVDTARVTGRDLYLTAEHDGVLVADVVTEWAGRYQPACTLILAGPAGGRWTFGRHPQDTLELDAIEFCRILSRRATGTGPLDAEVPF